MLLGVVRSADYPILRAYSGLMGATLSALRRISSDIETCYAVLHAQESALSNLRELMACKYNEAGINHEATPVLPFIWAKLQEEFTVSFSSSRYEKILNTLEVGTMHRAHALARFLVMSATLQKSMRALEELAERSINPDLQRGQTSLEAHIMALRNGLERISALEELNRSIHRTVVGDI